jgi:hypothetical protein
MGDSSTIWIMIHIKLPFKTPTINHLYWTNPKVGYKILTTEARKIRKQIEDIVKPMQDQAKDLQDRYLEVVVFIVEDWLTKGNEPIKKDIANREKFIIDSIFQALGMDDKWIWHIEMHKEQSKYTEECIVQIAEVNIFEEITP